MLEGRVDILLSVEDREELPLSNPKCLVLWAAYNQVHHYSSWGYFVTHDDFRSRPGQLRYLLWDKVTAAFTENILNVRTPG